MRITSIFFVIAMLPAAVGAAPLDKPACDSFKAEHARLLAQGLQADMNRGPEWAKANLAPERLKLIERLIEVEEQLSFRCREIVTARPLMKEPAKAEKTAEPKAKKGGVAGTSGDARAAAAAGPPPAKKKKPAAKAKPKGTESAAASKTSALP